MEIVLLERVENLGQMGDVVKVKPGFARNYLLPRQMALRANKANLAHFEARRAELEAANAARKSEAEGLAGKMAGLALVMVRQAGESGQLYGSVSARDIGDAIRAEGFTVERNQVQLHQPIKALGHYEVDVALHPDVKVAVVVNVARSQEEAALQAEEAAKLLEHPEDLVVEEAAPEEAPEEAAAEAPAEADDEEEE